MGCQREGREEGVAEQLEEDSRDTRGEYEEEDPERPNVL